MRLLGMVLGLVTLALLDGLTTGCGVPDAPGVPEGSFAIMGTLVENTCAPGLDPHETLSFIAELRREDGVGYWRQSGGAIVSGTMAEDGRFHFTSRTTIDVYGPDPDFGTAGCSLFQSETIDGVLVTHWDGDGGSEPSDGARPDAGAVDADAQHDGGRRHDGAAHDGGTADAGPSASFSGTNTVVISQTPGSDCALLLSANGGDFPSFPCQASYSMRGFAR